jgi:hypothetical protein
MSALNSQIPVNLTYTTTQRIHTYNDFQLSFCIIMVG